MQSKTQVAPDHVKGWILDAYPSDYGKIAVWIITESGERIKLTDNYQPKIYVSAKQDKIERLVSQLYNNRIISSWKFAYKYAQPTDAEKSKVLELTLKDCRKTQSLTLNILRMGDYLRYEIHNCDLKGDRAYFFSHDIFPLALVGVKKEETGLHYTLLDSATSTDYAVPELRVMKLRVEIAKKGKIANFQDPIDSVHITQTEKEICIASGEEAEKMFQIAKAVKEFDPDIIVTLGGDSYFFPYLTQRATINNVLSGFILSRDDTPLAPKTPSGKTFFSYGRTFYRAGAIRLYGRIHLDESNTFLLKQGSMV